MLPMFAIFLTIEHLRKGGEARELLEKLNVDVVCPPDHTCCGQPMGCYEEAQSIEEFFIRKFSAFDQVERLQWLPDLGAARCRTWTIWGTPRCESIRTRLEIPYFASLPAG
jgi:hypothetical protein